MEARMQDDLVTPQEYLAQERRAEWKSEYVNGRVYVMEGASLAHNLIIPRIGGLLLRQLDDRSCDVLMQHMRVRVSATGLYTYPDVVVACDPPEFEDDEQDTLLNPRVLIEVLSKTTEDYDRGDKFAHYRYLGSLTDYLLVAQDRMYVEHHQPQDDRTWRLRTIEGSEGVVELASIGCRLALADIYRRVPFKPGGVGRAPVVE